MARSIGMDRSQYHRLENADNADPSFATIVRIARQLDLSLDWLALTIGESADSKRELTATSAPMLLAAIERIVKLLAIELRQPEADRKESTSRALIRKSKQK